SEKPNPARVDILARPEPGQPCFDIRGIICSGRVLRAGAAAAYSPIVYAQDSDAPPGQGICEDKKWLVLEQGLVPVLRTRTCNEHHGWKRGDPLWQGERPGQSDVRLVGIVIADLLDPIREWRNWSLRAVRRGKDPALEADRDRGGPLLQDPLERSAISREGAFKYADAPYVHGHGAAVDTHLCRQAEHALIRAVEGRCLAKMQRGAQIYLAS